MEAEPRSVEKSAECGDEREVRLRGLTGESVFYKTVSEKINTGLCCFWWTSEALANQNQTFYLNNIVSLHLLQELELIEGANM